MNHKICEFCQHPADIQARICETCGKRFPLPKLKFGTKSECLQRALFWTAFNFLLIPLMVWGFVYALILRRFHLMDFLPIAGIWFLIVLFGILIAWFISDGESFGDAFNRAPRIDGGERFSGIGLEAIFTTLAAPFRRMTDAWSDFARHID